MITSSIHEEKINYNKWDLKFEQIQKEGPILQQSSKNKTQKNWKKKYIIFIRTIHDHFGSNLKILLTDF